MSDPVVPSEQSPIPADQEGLSEANSWATDSSVATADSQPDSGPDAPEPSPFEALKLSPAVLRAIEEVGYEAPSPIQAQTIPHILAGRDVVGQAQTGTGKTGAFALPLLSRINMQEARGQVQVLVLVPTRELAIQVSEAFARYAAYIPGFHVLPIYGGTGYEPQLKHLRKGSQVVVGTPGRLADHLRRGTLKLDNLQAVVLDEADEMLRMGFIDEVEWILEHTPAGRQIALFSATMPDPIRRIARNTLQDPMEITIRERTATASAIRQRYWLVSGMHKLDALTRLLEAEDFDAMIIFVRMKTAAAELARKLQARGLTCEALSGDVAQREREAIVERVRSGDTDILVATDVAARGLDVPRISHVLNYDIPLDTESYIHRIGRTGRAGRAGEAILFVSPRERRLLQAIEKATRQKITLMQMPSLEVIRDLRVTRFRQRILDVLAQEESLETYRAIVQDLEMEQGVDMADIAAACAHLAQGDGPPLEVGREYRPGDAPAPRSPQPERPAYTATAPTQATIEDVPTSRSDTFPAPSPFAPRPASPAGAPPEWAEIADLPGDGMAEEDDEDGSPAQGSLLDRVIAEESRSPRSKAPVVYRIALGHRDRVKPGMIVGAIANEADIPGKSIGNIQIENDHSLVVLPGNLTSEQERMLYHVSINGQPMKLVRAPEGTEVRPFVPSQKSSDYGDRPRGGFGGGGRDRGFAPRGGYGQDRPRQDFRPARDRYEDRDQPFRRPSSPGGDRPAPRWQERPDRDDRPAPRYEDRPQRGGFGTPDRSRDSGGSRPPFGGGKRGFGAPKPAGRGFGSAPDSFRRSDDDSRPPFRRDRDERPDFRDKRDSRPDRDSRDDGPRGGGDRRDFRPGPGGKPKPRFQPPWGFPKGAKPGKPKR